MRIGIDVDGVTADIGDEILYRLQEEGNIIPPGFVFHQFDISQQFGVGGDWIGKQFADPTFWLNAKPFEDAWTCINKWFSKGHDIFFITCRWEVNRPETERWLNEWDLPYNELFMGIPHLNKHKVMQKHNIPVLIEDRNTEIEQVLANGLTGVLMDRTWNGPVEGAYYVKSFYEIDRMIANGEI